MTNFNRWAASFDDARRMERAGIIAAYLAQRMQPYQGGSALEYGCGTGLVGLSLAPLFADMTLMDASAGMIRVLQDKHPAQTIHPVQHNLMDAPYPGQFDVIFSSMVLHHIVPAEQIIGIFGEMLKEGGMLCIVDLDAEDGTFHSEEPDFDGYNGFSQPHIAEMMEAAGFRELNIGTFYHGSKRIGAQDTAYSLFCASGVMKKEG